MISISGACFSVDDQGGHTPVEVHVEGISGGAVYFSACQDHSGDNLCGIDGDPFANELCGRSFH